MLAFAVVLVVADSLILSFCLSADLVVSDLCLGDLSLQLMFYGCWWVFLLFPVNCPSGGRGPILFHCNAECIRMRFFFLVCVSVDNLDY